MGWLLVVSVTGKYLRIIDMRINYEHYINGHCLKFDFHPPRAIHKGPTDNPIIL